MNRKKISSATNIFFSILFLVFVVIAIAQQLRRPPEERTWNGRIARIPYDFRIPTAERIRAAYWNKETSKILLPQAFGIGWALNLYPLLHPEEVKRLK